MIARWPSLGAALAAALLAAPSCAPPQSKSTARNTLVVGIDVSGSFRDRHYDDAIDFAAYYLYGHLHGLGGLRVPTAVFVGSVGGEKPGEVKSFHPIQDFADKSIEQLAQDLKAWFPPEDALTDFNPFFERVATLVKRQNLVLAPLNIVVLSDGLPDVGRASPQDTLGPYGRISVSPLEYLSRNVTVRLLYPSPTTGARWERNVSRRRVRLWTQDDQVMVGWRTQLAVGEPPEAQDKLWSWINDNVDFRVRARIL
jgi:hypothetical protein